MGKKLPLIKATTPSRNRNAFDLSQRHLFTAHAGMLLPVLSLDLLPHDHVEINASDFMRTLPMNTASFLSMRGVYEFYFVPYKQIWSDFDQFITGMSDFRSSLNYKVYTDNGKKVPHPRFKLHKLFEQIDNVNKKIKLKDAEQDLLKYNNYFNVNRLLDLLGYGRNFSTSNSIYTIADSALQPLNKRYNDLEVSVSPFRICAYNKIYQDYYRNSTYEPYDVNSFSLDNNQDNDLSPDFILKCLKLHYRNSQLDYFTNIRPSYNFLGDNFNGTIIPSHLGFPRVDHGNGTEEINIDEYTTQIVGASDDQDRSHFSVNSIRAAFAVDKLLSITMRAGKTFQEQMKAHYGVDVPTGRDGRCFYLGGFDSNVQVSDVDQTSGTTQVGDYSPIGGYLGRTTGKGTGSGSGRVVFDAKEHGVLMCIYSLVPDFQFDSTRVDPMVTKLNRFDYFTPEFENLGMQPLDSRYVSSINFGNLTKSKVLGYQPRYSEYKTALDINHGQFSLDGALSYYSVSRNRNFNTRLDFPYIRPSSFKIDPAWLNSIFVVDYNGSELTDCVFGGCNFNIVKVSDMSEDGMPRV